MKKTTILTHRDYVNRVVKKLHESGLMEIIDISTKEATDLGDQKASEHQEFSYCKSYEDQLSTLISILSSQVKKPSGIKAMLQPTLLEKERVEDFSLRELTSYIEGILTEIEQPILSKQQRLDNINETTANIEHHQSALKDLRNFKFNLTDIGTSSYLVVAIGKTNDLSGINKRIEQLKTATVYDDQINTGKNPTWTVLLVGHRSEEKQIQRLISEFIEEYDLPSLEKTPLQAIDDLSDQQESLQEEKKQIIHVLQDLATDHLSHLRALKEQIQLLAVRRQVPKNFATTTSTIIIRGWVLEEQETQLRRILQEASEDHVIIESKTPSTNPDNPPTFIKTPKWAQSFQTLLSLFGTPRYNEIDPTIIMGFFFLIFFGIMLGDAGYGSVILILSIVAYLKFKSYDTMINTWAFMGILLGIITTTVGALTNSLFGDFIPRFFYGNPDLPLYQLSIGGITLPLEPLRDPLTILVVALILGLMHLNVGILLGLYQAYKRKEYKVLLTERSCWIPLQIGGGMLIGNFILDWPLSAVLLYAAIALVIIGMIQLFMHSGPVGFFDITGYVGDWLSYARLLALGLATAGMALAFNVVAELIPEMVPLVGIVLLPIILVVAHLANLLLQALGAGVHSLRLQYVEFFNRFYQGGGHTFTPFKIKRRYTEVKQEKNTE